MLQMVRVAVALLWFVLLLVGAWAQSWKAHCAVDRQSELHK
jgi:hypothetical protein